MTFSLATYVAFVILLLIQVLAALPWVLLLFLNPDRRAALFASLRGLLTNSVLMRGALVALIAILGIPAVFQVFVLDRDTLQTWGWIYGAVLQMQLLADLFILGFVVLLWAWPKGGAVALSAFREGVRQPMFWLLALCAWGLMSISPLFPYWTFGQDYLMVKQMGYDAVLLFATLFGTLAASLFITEEIEGRTAVTLMSKPVSRRQFLLGKFVGIVAACGVLFAILGTYLEGVLIFEHWWDKLGVPGERATAIGSQPNVGVVPAPLWLTSTLASLHLPGGITGMLRGIGLWTAHSLDTWPGLILAFSQVMVLVAIAVALATRVPMVVNLTTVLVVYFLANLTPQLVAKGKQAQIEDPGSPVSQMLSFTGQLCDTLFPDLGSFRLDPILTTDAPPPAIPFLQYLGSVTLYGLLYTSLVLLIGLVLFEDRDLA